jgi:pimeloyl-ACP methyl ester carboxylesterase
MKKLLFFLTILSLASCSNPTQNKISYGSNPAAGKYIEVNDIKIYYETYGSGEPLFLLHGGGGSIANFSMQIPELSRHFKVIAVDSRAQGRTTDSDKEITYALMASDMAALIDKLQLGSVNVLGWSDGGNTGLELAYAYPGKVKKLVVFGTNYNHENSTVQNDSIKMNPDDPLLLKTKTYLEEYRNNPEKLSPDPGKLPAIYKKLYRLWDNYPNFSVDQLKTIKTPTLIVAGDHDLIAIDQTITLYNSLPNAELFIVPCATHLVLAEQPTLMNKMILGFLQTPFRKINNIYFAHKLHNSY